MPANRGSVYWVKGAARDTIGASVVLKGISSTLGKSLSDLVHTRLRALAVNFNSFYASGDYAIIVPSTN